MEVAEEDAAEVDQPVVVVEDVPPRTLNDEDVERPRRRKRRRTIMTWTRRRININDAALIGRNPRTGVPNRCLIEMSGTVRGRFG